MGDDEQSNKRQREQTLTDLLNEFNELYDNNNNENTAPLFRFKTCKQLAFEIFHILIVLSYEPLAKISLDIKLNALTTSL